MMLIKRLKLATMVKGRQTFTHYSLLLVLIFAVLFLQVGLNCENLAEKWAQRESTHDN